MATKEVYEISIKVLEHFISRLRETGSIVGISYSFSPRKAQIDYMADNMGVIIRANEVFVHSQREKGSLRRPHNEAEAFQMNCTGEYFCDKLMEDKIKEAFDRYYTYVCENLYIGEWED